MKRKYHVNPDTGESGYCRAKFNCPFDRRETGVNHYDTYQEAVEAGKKIKKKKYGVLSGSLERRKKILASNLHDEWRRGRLFVDIKSMRSDKREPRWKECSLTEKDYSERIKEKTFQAPNSLDARKIHTHNWNDVLRKNENGNIEIDIANVNYDNLPSDWQKENKDAANVVMEKLRGRYDLSYLEMREAASHVHDEWLKRSSNSWAKGGELDVPFDELSYEEQRKDMVQVELGMKVNREVREGVDTNIYWRQTHYDKYAYDPSDMPSENEVYIRNSIREKVKEENRDYIETNRKGFLLYFPTKKQMKNFDTDELKYMHKNNRFVEQSTHSDSINISSEQYQKLEESNSIIQEELSKRELKQLKKANRLSFLKKREKTDQQRLDDFNENRWV